MAQVTFWWSVGKIGEKVFPIKYNKTHQLNTNATGNSESVSHYMQIQI